MVNGGPIGGLDQSGTWKLNARFNKDELVRRIEKISLYRDQIFLYNMDAIDFMKQIVIKNKALDNALVYLDPPYYAKGRRLYLNYYEHKDHAQLAQFLKQQNTFKWIMSYDNVPEIHQLYSRESEVVFFQRDCLSPPP